MIGDMDTWVVPESKPCGRCGGTEDTGHTKACDDWYADICLDGVQGTRG